MCGIAGAFHYKTGKPVSNDLLKIMSDVIVHRGPDDEGFYTVDSVGLAFRRLSIIDLNTGNQPIHNEEKSVWVIFNGEIYNYVELKQDLKARGHTFYTESDTEVIVHLYEEYGMDFPIHLNGMYGIALWDEKKRTLLLIRDRPGIKPLYYAETDAGLLFGSEIKSLLSSGVSRAPDHEAINQYLAYGYIPSPRTGFHSICKLDPGHILKCTPSGWSIQEFWDVTEGTSQLENLGEDELVDMIIDELQRVLHRQTRSDVPLGIFLSGGIDSSLIASVAAEKCNISANAFTIGFEEESYNELGNARLVADKLGLKLHEFILSEQQIFQEIERIMSFLDEPLFDFSAIPVYFISKLAREHVKTVVSGEGGDELFGGYPTHYLHMITEWYRKIPAFLRSGIQAAISRMRESHSYLSTSYKLKRFTYGADFPYDQSHYRWKVIFDAAEKKQLLSSDFLDSIAEPEPFSSMEKYFLKAVESGLDVPEQLLYVDFKTFLQDDLLHKTDRMSMANSLEVRVPLLDNAIIDLSRRVPIRKKIKRFQTKYLLRKTLSRFQSDEIAFGKKRGFTPPMAHWIKNGLKDYMYSFLSQQALAGVEFLNHKHVSRIIDDHISGRAENSRQIWALVALINWYRNYVAH